MKYLKRFGKINEDIKILDEDLDFDTFKDIMTLITDDYNQVKFKNYSDENFYDCQILIFNEDFNNTYDMLENISKSDYYRDLISPIDDPMSFSEIIEANIIDQIEEKIENIKKFDFTYILNQQEKFINTLIKIEQDIIPRFTQYKNYYDCMIGYDDNKLRVTFELEEK
jgi:hypothetical protein